MGPPNRLNSLLALKALKALKGCWAYQAHPLIHQPLIIKAGSLPLPGPTYKCELQHGDHRLNPDTRGSSQ